VKTGYRPQGMGNLVEELDVYQRDQSSTFAKNLFYKRSSEPGMAFSVRFAGNFAGRRGARLI